MRKLLLVDDDPHIRRLLRIYLRDSGFQITEAAAGDEADSLLDTERFDVLLLDLILPYHGGFLLCQHAKEVEGEKPYVIIMTGEDSPETRTTAHDCGADAFIAKPFSREDIVAAVQTASSASATAGS
jgi:two-component system, OmpR family, response regulator